MARPVMSEAQKKAAEEKRVATKAALILALRNKEFQALSMNESMTAQTLSHDVLKECGQDIAKEFGAFLESAIEKALEEKRRKDLHVLMQVSENVQSCTFPTGNGRGRDSSKDPRWDELPDFVGFQRNDRKIVAKVDREAKRLTVNWGQEGQRDFTSPSSLASDADLFGKEATISGWSTMVYVHSVDDTGKTTDIQWNGTGAYALGERVKFTERWETSNFSGQEIQDALTRILNHRSDAGFEANGTLESKILAILEPWKFRAAK